MTDPSSSASTASPATTGPPPGIRTVGEAAPGGATRVVLIRHGEATCNVAGVVGGLSGCTGLSPLGVVQAEALRARLAETGELAGTEALYSSVLARALETAAIVAPALSPGLEVAADCGLCELHPGDADGMRWEEFVDRYGEPDWDADPGAPLAPGGESWTGFVARAADAVDSVVARHRGQTVVVVCHAGVIEATLLRFLPVATVPGRLKLRTAHTSMTEWERDSDGWRLLRYNDAAHLWSGGRSRSPQHA